MEKKLWQDQSLRDQPGLRVPVRKMFLQSLPRHLTKLFTLEEAVDAVMNGSDLELSSDLLGEFIDTDPE